MENPNLHFPPLHQACKINLLLEFCNLTAKDNWQLVRPKLGESDTFFSLQKPQKTIMLNERMKNFSCCTLFINSKDFFSSCCCVKNPHNQQDRLHESQMYMWETGKATIYGTVIKNKVNTEEKLEEKIYLLIIQWKQSLNVCNGLWNIHRRKKETK